MPGEQPVELDSCPKPTLARASNRGFGMLLSAGRKQGSRYGGHWHGPARVLCYEGMGDVHDPGSPGSVVWISHARRLLRWCA